MSETPPTSVRDAEIAVEQRHIDIVYQRVTELREEARAMRERGYRVADGARSEADLEQGQMLLTRDVMVAHASKLLQALDTGHEGLVFGRLDDRDGTTMYVGRIGVRDAAFDNLVTDWRAPAAAPFYQATPEHPMGMVRRRVIRSSSEVVLDVDDDLLDAAALPADMPVVGEGALMASLTQARGEHMHAIVATIQREQDEAIRAPWQGVTEITGGPGTGKTAVALHRAAYLLYRERRRMGGSGVLVVGPSTVFTNYISRVLPSMGEESVELRALGEILDGVHATRADSAALAALKGSPRMARLLRKAARQAPAQAPAELPIVYRGRAIRLDGDALGGVRRAVHALGHPPNRARVLAAEALLEALALQATADADADGTPPPDSSALIDEIGERIDFHRFVVAWWPQREPGGVLRELAEPERLAAVAGRTLGQDDVHALAGSWCRDDWSVADVALLDELRVLLGTPPKRARGRDSEGRHSVAPAGSPRNFDEYSHIVVDESQDLSPMQWRMVGRRGRYASWTVVGDPVQSSWPRPGEAARAATKAFGGPRTPRRRFTLRTNYRNSAEIFGLARRVVDGVAGDDELPDAVRTTGINPYLRAIECREADVRAAVIEMLAAVDGTVGVISAMARVSEVDTWIAGLDERARAVGSLAAKGLEYDGVVLLEPAELLAESLTGPRPLYVALTRATQRLTVLSCDPGWISRR